MPDGTVTKIELPVLAIERMKFYLVGTAPLLIHAFPEKARKKMLDKQTKTAKGGRDAREPLKEVEDCRYRLPDGRDGFPAVGFKSAAVTACTAISDVTKIAARQAFRVAGTPMNTKGLIEGSFVRTALVPLIVHEPTIREDVVHLSGPKRQSEMRYRPEFFPWGVELDIELNPQVISVGQLGSMFLAAGMGVGVGDYRPERNGDCGTFDLVSEAEFTDWRKASKL